nr:MAG TPA: hypothetical protein [Caudoviricetes sp.]
MRDGWKIGVFVGRKSLENRILSAVLAEKLIC